MIKYEEPDTELFNEALGKRRNRIQGEMGVGTLREKTVHSVLKYYYAPNDKYHEIPIDGFVADACVDGEIIEIQTRHFYAMKKKLEAFLKDHEVTIVYPVVVRNRITWTDKDTGEVQLGRKSYTPKKVYDIFPELYSIRTFLDNPSLHFVLALISTEDYRFNDGYGKDGKKHATKCDKVPTEIIGEIKLYKDEDFTLFTEDIPEGEFTISEFAKIIGYNYADTGCMLAVLSQKGFLEKTGRGRYKRV